MRIVARMGSFGDRVRALDDGQLVALLTRRPDLASPSPSTLTSLAVRATSRASLDRALAGVDARVLQVLEAAVVLDGVSSDAQAGEADAPAPTAGAIADALGATSAAERDAVRSSVAAAVDLLLLWPAAPTRRGTAPAHAALRPCPGLSEALGPYPGGLGPATGWTSPDGVADPGLVRTLATAPPGAAGLLGALAWGPPVGAVPPGAGARAAVDWLVRRGLLLADGPTSDRVLLPREVALALRTPRDGAPALRTHRAPVQPPSPGGAPRPAAVADTEGASAAEETVRVVAGLVRSWEQEPPGVLRSGGLGVRDLRRLAADLEVPVPTAAFAVELAAAAGLVVDDGDEVPHFVPSLAVDAWLDSPTGTRWELLATAWLLSPRTSWLVGSRDDKAALRPALDPELVRPWVPHLRDVVLAVLDDARLAGEAPATRAAGHEATARPLDADDVLASLRWRTPRATPPASAVAGLLEEAALLGVTGLGVLTGHGRALRTHPAGTLDALGSAALTAPEPGAAALALEATLPATVDELLVQGDLTGVVPGRPSPALAALLDRTADVESRGAALTVRFAESSVRRSLDAGASADALLTELAAFSRSPLPQPLDYLVRDAARRHGRMRVGAAESYVRTEDPALVAAILADPTLGDLRLVALAPTVLAAQAPAAVVLTALRERGLAPAAEGPDGEVVTLGPTARRARGSRRAARAREAHTPERAEAVQARLAELVPRLRAASRGEAAGAGSTTARGTGGAAGATARRAAAPHVDPVDALATLREAASDAAPVWLEVVSASGLAERRRVLPLTVDAGRVRVRDLDRDAELTVAVHRIARASRVSG